MEHVKGKDGKLGHSWSRGFTLRRLRKPNDLLRLPGNALPAVVWVDCRESPPFSSSWWRCLLLGTLRFLMRGGVRNARIGEDLRALVDCWPTDWSVWTEGDNELERSPSTCKVGFSDGNVASILADDFLAAWFSSFSNSTIDNSRADSDWLRRWRQRLPASDSETGSRNHKSFNVLNVYCNITLLQFLFKLKTDWILKYRRISSLLLLAFGIGKLNFHV